VYEVEEVERVWRELKAAGAGMAEGSEEEAEGDVVMFRDRRPRTAKER
jgi:hypothetical protein